MKVLLLLLLFMSRVMVGQTISGEAINIVKTNDMKTSTFSSVPVPSLDALSLQILTDGNRNLGLVQTSDEKLFSQSTTRSISGVAIIDLDSELLVKSIPLHNFMGGFRGFNNEDQFYVIWGQENGSVSLSHLDDFQEKILGP